MTAPYWESRDGKMVVFNARYEQVLELGCVKAKEFALIHDDPPYGVNANTGGRGLGRREAFDARGARKGSPVDVRHAAVTGDHAPFDASLLLALDRPTVIWGGHLCQPALPSSISWLYWDKRELTGSDDNGDGELAWSNLGGPIRRFAHLWRGTCRASETGTAHLHGTQKPVKLCRWIYQRAKLRVGDRVFVPHGGSGPDLVTCREAGLRLIWCDVERWCCDVAIARLPEAPVEIIERARRYQISIRATQSSAVGPLFERAT